MVELLKSMNSSKIKMLFRNYKLIDLITRRLLIKSVTKSYKLIASGRRMNPKYRNTIYKKIRTKIKSVVMEDNLFKKHRLVHNP